METETPPAQAAAAATPPPAAAAAPVRPPHRLQVYRSMNLRVYKSLKPGKQREAYLARFKRRRGIPVANQKKKKEEKQEEEPMPSPQRMVPGNFVWPEGLDREEFLAKKPGAERMAYLAFHIKRHALELQPAMDPRRIPLGRKPDALAHPRCGCSSSEACSSCSRCVELHCVCGLSGRPRRALCMESRACNCVLTDPSARCKLCHGCRQPRGLSHCRCVLHQRFLWTKRHPELNVELTEEEEKAVCSCFLLNHRHGGAAATKKREAKARNEMERVRRIKRAIGFSSSDNIYRSRKIATFLGDEGLENDLDDGVDDGPGTEILPPRTENVIPRTMITRFLDPYFKPASYHPLFRSDGCSLLESIEPRGGHVNRRKFGAHAINEEVSRGLENMLYEIDRNAAMPSDDLVDYLVYMASVKSSNIGELIGSFDDSAAVAGSIVIEEYMTQLMEDAVEQKKALCPVTEASVQSFTRELLSGFNWRLFEQQNCSSLSDSLTDQAALADKVAELILPEFVSTQPLQFDVGAHKADLLRWIRSAVAIPSLASTGEGPHITTNMQTNEKASNLGDDRQDNEVEKAQRTHRIRLSVKANPMHGHPAYKLHFTTALKDGHHVETSVGGLDSKEKAKATIMQLSKAVERQEERSKRAQEGHQQQQVPAPTRVDPIAPPVLHPPPPTDPNDPDTPMFLHVWEHFNAYAKQKWEASVAASSNALTSEDEASATEQSTEPYQGRPKRRKVSSQ